MNIPTYKNESVARALAAASRFQYIGKDESLDVTTTMWALPIRNIGILLRLRVESTVKEPGSKKLGREVDFTILGPIPCGVYVQAIVDGDGREMFRVCEFNRDRLGVGVLQELPPLKEEA